MISVFKDMGLLLFDEERQTLTLRLTLVPSANVNVILTIFADVTMQNCSNENGTSSLSVRMTSVNPSKLAASPDPARIKIKS